MWMIVAAVILIAIIGSAMSMKQPAKVGEDGAQTSSDTAKNDSKKEEKNEFNVGDVIAIDKKKVTVVNVERDWNSGSEFTQPKDGKEFVKVVVKIENDSDEEQSYNDTFDWKMQDGNGALETLDIMASSQLGDNLGSGDLAPGGKKEGVMIFEVPKGDANLKLQYKPVWSTQSFKVNL